MNTLEKKEMKSVLHILHSIKYSGLEKMLYFSGEYFKKNGFDSYVLATEVDLGEFAPILKEVDYKILHLPIRNRIRHFFSLYELFLKYKFDVIHNHTEQNSFWYFVVLKLAGAKSIISTIHSIYIFKKLVRAKRFLYRYISRKLLGVKYVSIGPSVKSVELEQYRNPTQKILNWIHRSDFNPASINEKTKLRNSNQIGLQKKVIISVGSCLELKNHRDILIVVRKLKDAGVDVLYLHLGDGPLSSEEKKLAAELKVEDDVLFMGQQLNVRDFLVMSDVYVMPSDYEGFSLSLMEALNCGIPSVVYDSYGLVDIVIHGKNGLISECSPESLFNNCLKLLSDERMREKFSQNAIEYSNEVFDMEKSVKKYIELYNS